MLCFINTQSRETSLTGLFWQNRRRYFRVIWAGLGFSFLNFIQNRVKFLLSPSSIASWNDLSSGIIMKFKYLPVKDFRCTNFLFSSADFCSKTFEGSSMLIYILAPVPQAGELTQNAFQSLQLWHQHIILHEVLAADTVMDNVTLYTFIQFTVVFISHEVRK